MAGTDRRGMHRREFLTASAALPGLGLQTGATARAAERHPSFDPWIEVHAAHLRTNAAAVHKLTGVPILAVIKSNGYGAGTVHVRLDGVMMTFTEDQKFDREQLGRFRTLTARLDEARIHISLKHAASS